MRGHCEIGSIVQHAAMNLFLIFQYGLIGLLVVLVTLFSSVMFCETCTEWMGERLGLYTKNPILKFLGIGMGGVLLALQALMSYKRAKALEDTAKAQAEAAKAQAKATEEQAKANQNTEQGQRQERLKNAIEHLGHPSDSVRLGGAYELFHLAQDTKDLRQTVLDILCAHIRRTTGEAEYRKKYKSKPSEEIQSLLTLLFVQEHEVFKGLHINLQGSWLNGANLRESRLRRADLAGSYLRGTELTDADLKEANMARVHMQSAFLFDAQLQGADLRWAQLQRVDFRWAQLQVVDFRWAQVQAAFLALAYLQGADLRWAQLQGAFLPDAQLQGASLPQAQLQGATSYTMVRSSFLPFEKRIAEQIDEDSALDGTTFEGGLSQEDLDSFVEGLSDEKARQLRAALEPHVGKPASHELEGRGAIIGAYTKEEAEQWVAEYNEAMSEVPEESDN